MLSEDDIVSRVMSDPGFRMRGPLSFDGNEPLSTAERRSMLSELIATSPHVFLERYGKLLSEDELEFFGERFQGVFEVEHFLKACRRQMDSNPRETETESAVDSAGVSISAFAQGGSACPQLSAETKNRRFRKLQQLAASGYFEETAMRERAPALFTALVARLPPQPSGAGGRGCVRASALLETLDHQREEEEILGQMAAWQKEGQEISSLLEAADERGGKGTRREKGQESKGNGFTAYPRGGALVGSATTAGGGVGLGGGAGGGVWARPCGSVSLLGEDSEVDAVLVGLAEEEEAARQRERGAERGGRGGDFWGEFEAGGSRTVQDDRGVGQGVCSERDGISTQHVDREGGDVPMEIDSDTVMSSGVGRGAAGTLSDCLSGSVHVHVQSVLEGEEEEEEDAFLVYLRGSNESGSAGGSVSLFAEGGQSGLPPAPSTSGSLSIHTGGGSSFPFSNGMQGSSCLHRHSLVVSAAAEAIKIARAHQSCRRDEQQERRSLLRQCEEEMGEGDEDMEGGPTGMQSMPEPFGQLSSSNRAGGFRRGGGRVPSFPLHSSSSMLPENGCMPTVSQNVFHMEREGEKKHAGEGGVSVGRKERELSVAHAVEEIGQKGTAKNGSVCVEGESAGGSFEVKEGGKAAVGPLPVSGKEKKNRRAAQSVHEERKEREGEGEMFSDLRDLSREEFESRMEVFRREMQERFLEGRDGEFVDYKQIDADEGLDDFEQLDRDAEDAWFAD
uniref:CCD97-like C-terminal domain-containing protein n=1 Tax=Chromera velia CCMP2878 TaxID=1169474 RepID=A0A0K6S6R8_9ALVE|eukprot:Cvel_18418.t1-p1 / transcript=Cvel_18418.t1 / gene=Cvel_18418 / organism=Chromera_velia_CCMP2878 / gene_product=hypothetical protein / transcript_product=hypothetical protein / location=Cvel_scaffold1524:601-3457(-) / protein_length=732 / sequence_SO=supercontig / SO=protein_coding / is_pseudo=false